MLLRLARRRCVQSLRQASTGPIAAYNALVDAGKIKRDSHQLNALVPLQRLHEEIAETGYAPAPREVKEDNEEASTGLMTKFASFAQSMGVAIGGDTNRPSGAAGPVVRSMSWDGTALKHTVWPVHPSGWKRPADYPIKGE